MNHQVLSGDLANGGSSSPASRFRNDDPTADSQSMDYRHVPLVDEEENRLDQSIVSPAQQNMIL